MITFDTMRFVVFVIILLSAGFIIALAIISILKAGRDSDSDAEIYRLESMNAQLQQKLIRSWQDWYLQFRRAELYKRIINKKEKRK